MHENDFSPSLPQLNSPRYHGVEATLTLDRGTAGVLAMRLEGTDYRTATYGDPNVKLVKGLVIGGLLIFIAVTSAVAYGHFLILSSTSS